MRANQHRMHRQAASRPSAQGQAAHACKPEQSAQAGGATANPSHMSEQPRHAALRLQTGEGPMYVCVNVCVCVCACVCVCVTDWHPIIRVAHHHGVLRQRLPVQSPRLIQVSGSVMCVFECVMCVPKALASFRWVLGSISMCGKACLQLAKQHGARAECRRWLQGWKDLENLNRH